jgi:hypothetical protein
MRVSNANGDGRGRRQKEQSCSIVLQCWIQCGIRKNTNKYDHLHGSSFRYDDVHGTTERCSWLARFQRANTFSTGNTHDRITRIIFHSCYCISCLLLSGNTMSRLICRKRCEASAGRCPNTSRLNRDLACTLPTKLTSINCRRLFAQNQPQEGSSLTILVTSGDTQALDPIWQKPNWPPIDDPPKRLAGSAGGFSGPDHDVTRDILSDAQ